MKRPNIEGMKYNGTISSDGVTLWVNDEMHGVVRISGIDNVSNDNNSSRCKIHFDEKSGFVDIIVENSE